VNPNKALWEKGDFTEIAAFMRPSGEALVESLGITMPLRALDLGCGDGTTAIPLARLGAEVTGIDITRNLVEAGNKRAAAAGLPRLTFQEGDACNLQGVSDRSFDLTLSIFGAIAQMSGTVEELRGQLVELARAQNKGGDGSTSIPATFLRVTVSV
jgi:ubiquinone/menaquinone biosynthesis C-methylase UbiE